MVQPYWEYLQQVFDHAYDLGPDERESYLEEVARSHPEIVCEVRELLDNVSEAEEHLPSQFILGDGWLSALAQELGIEEHAIPDQIGNYRIIEQLGAGGMGVVFRAEESQPKREVAIKVIRKHGSNLPLEDFFRRELQALAMMNHPHIAHLYGSGETEDHQPYLVMEYIQGVPITQFCDLHQLSISERLKLFLQVCEGVSSAHRKGVIHGDLKPSNILVKIENDAHQAKIIDFGIARSYDDRAQKLLQDERGILFGAPPYMAPECLDFVGAADVTSDVYSLGALLLELLSGTKVLEESSYLTIDHMDKLEQVRQLIRSKQAVRPSERVAELGNEAQTIVAKRGEANVTQLVNRLEGDLDLITEHALENQPHARYRDVGELQQDITHYLDSRPISLCNQRLYRLRLYLRRERLKTLAWVALLCVILVLIGSYFQIRASRDRAEQSLAMLRKTQNFYRQFITSPNPANRGRDITMLEVIEEAEGEVSFYANGEPLLEAAVRRMLGETYFGLAAYDRAEKQLDLALALYPPDSPSAAVCKDRLARVKRVRGYLSEAQALFEEAIARLEKDPSYRPELALALSGLSLVFTDRGETQQAYALSRKAYQQIQKVTDPDSRSYQTIAINLANILASMQDRKRAIELLEKVADQQEVRYGQGHPLTMLTKLNLAGHLLKFNQTHLAMEILEQLESHANKLGEKHPTLYAIRHEKALAYYKTNRYREGVSLLEEVLKKRKQIFEAGHRDILLAMNDLALGYSNLGEQHRAIEFYRELLHIYRETSREETEPAIIVASNLGNELNHMGSYEEALKYLERALAIAKENLKTHLVTLDTMVTLGETYLGQERFENALHLFDQAAVALEQLRPIDRQRQALYLGLAAYSRIRLGQFEAAYPVMKQSYIDLQENAAYRQLIERLLVEACELNGRKDLRPPFEKPKQ